MHHWGMTQPGGIIQDMVLYINVIWHPVKENVLLCRILTTQVSLKIIVILVYVLKSN